MLRHPGEGQDPVRAPITWIPAFAGMTEELWAYASLEGERLMSLVLSRTAGRTGFLVSSFQETTHVAIDDA